MSVLYGRKAAITVVDADTSASAKGSRKKGIFYPRFENAVRVEDHRVNFSITLDRGKEPDKAEVQIFNLNKDTRSLFAKKPSRVKIEAGYEDSPLARIFTGDLVYGTSTKQGPDWITTLQLGDGQRAFKHARFSRTYKPGTKTENIQKGILESMGLTAATDAPSALQLFRDVSANGISFQGSSEKALSKMLKPGVGWHTSDGTVRFFQRDRHNPDYVLSHIISQETGLLGIPEFGAPDKPGGKPILKIRTRLNSEIRPGVVLSIQSQYVNGLYGVSRVQITGDTRAAPWYSDIEAIAV